MKILIEKGLFDRLKYITDKCNTEIALLGWACVDDEDISVCGLFDLDTNQKVHGTEAELTAEHVAKCTFEIMNMRRNGTNAIMVWWHSHASMQTFWSSQDKKQIKELSKNQPLLAIVQNKKAETRCCFVVSETVFSPRVEMDNVELVTTISIEQFAEYDKQMAEIVENNKPKWTGGPAWYSKHWSEDSLGKQDSLAGIYQAQENKKVEKVEDVVRLSQIEIELRDIMSTKELRDMYVGNFEIDFPNTAMTVEALREYIKEDLRGMYA